MWERPWQLQDTHRPSKGPCHSRYCPGPHTWKHTSSVHLSAASIISSEHLFTASIISSVHLSTASASGNTSQQYTSPLFTSGNTASVISPLSSPLPLSGNTPVQKACLRVHTDIEKLVTILYVYPHSYQLCYLFDILSLCYISLYFIKVALNLIELS